MLVEILKQDIYSPIPFEKQVCAIYAWINWYLDKIEVSKIKSFEKDLYAELDEENSIITKTKETWILDDESTEALIKLIKEVVKQY